MAITHIGRDWGTNPSLVRITTTDSLNDILSPGYLASQSEAIELLNNGEFSWKENDMVAISASDGKGVFVRDAEGNLSFADGAMQQASVTLQPADVIAMFAAPVQLLPAPGEDRMIRVLDVEYVLDFDSAQYTGGGAIQLQYGDTINAGGLSASVDLAAATLNGYAADSTVGVSGESESGDAADKVNEGIYISNDTAAFATGDSPVTVKIWFSVINAGLA